MCDETQSFIIARKMSHSREERLANRKLALEFLIKDLEDHPINRVSFLIGEPPYDVIYPTTWQDLIDEYFIKPVGTPAMQLCAFTGHGWLWALRMLGIEQSPEILDQVGRLMAVLKGHVKGRQQEEYELTANVAREAQVSEGFVYNIIESSYIDLILNRKGATWAHGDNGHMVRIPVNFGSERL